MLRLERLSKTYADGTQALSAINVEVGGGEILALVGGSEIGRAHV